MAGLPGGTHILSGTESQRLRSFCSDAIWTPRDLDEYAWLLRVGPFHKIEADFQRRVSATSLEEARAALASIAYGPGKIPLYNYLLQLIYLDPASRKLHFSTIRYLAEEAKVPVDSTDLSGTTTLMWCSDSGWASLRNVCKEGRSAADLFEVWSAAVLRSAVSKERMEAAQEDVCPEVRIVHWRGEKLLSLAIISSLR